jgi:hypothetical protein
VLLSLEALEDRRLMSGPPLAPADPTSAQFPGITFQFVFDDPDHQFDAFPLLGPDLDAAGQILSGLLGGSGTLEVLVRPNNAIPRSSGNTVGVFAAGTDGGRTVYRGAALQEALTGTDPNGSGPEIELDLNTQTYLPGAWFDPSGAARAGSVPPGQTDFISVALHELMHGLGFGGYRAIDGPACGTLPADHESDFDALTAFGAGADAGVLYFTGSHAVALSGGPVPLTSVGPSAPLTSQNFYHVGNPAGLPGAELLPDLMNGVVFTYGTRYTVTPLDLAILADLGWPQRGPGAGVSSCVAPLPPVTPTTSFLVSWSGSADPGVATYDVYVSDDGGPSTAWLTGTAQTSATFTGQNGHTYAFYSVATDGAGNVQPTPTAPQASTVVDAAPLLSTMAPLPAVTASPSFTVSWSGSQGPGGPGIRSFDVYVSVDGGPFQPWLTDTARTSATFAGQDGQAYAFTSVATDALGLRASSPPVSTVVQAPRRPVDVTAQVRVLPGKVRRRGRRLGQLVALTNTGATAVAGPMILVLTGLPRNVRLVRAGGRAPVEATPDGPQVDLGTGLAPGATLTVGLQFEGATSRLRYAPRVLSGP